MSQELIDYIRTQLQAGISEQEVRRALLGAGWAEVDVEAAFRATQSVPVFATAPLPLTPPTADEHSSYTKEKEKLHRRKRVLIITIVVIVVLTAGALAGYYFWLRESSGLHVSSQPNDQRLDAQQETPAHPPGGEIALTCSKEAPEQLPENRVPGSVIIAFKEGFPTSSMRDFLLQQKLVDRILTLSDDSSREPANLFAH